MIKRLADFSPEKLEELQDKYDHPQPNGFRLLRLKDLRSKEEFDEYGIRFPADYLNKMGIAVVLLPVEYMAEYVDVITKEAVDDQDASFFINGMPADAEFTEEDATRINATSIGNLAYVYLYLENKQVKEKCKQMLDMMYRYAA